MGLEEENKALRELVGQLQAYCEHQKTIIYEMAQGMIGYGVLRDGLAAFDNGGEAHDSTGPNREIPEGT